MIQRFSSNLSKIEKGPLFELTMVFLQIWMLSFSFKVVLAVNQPFLKNLMKIHSSKKNNFVYTLKSVLKECYKNEYLIKHIIGQF